MAKNTYRKSNFKSLNELDSYKVQLKDQRKALKQEIVKDLLNPVTIALTVSKNIIGKFKGKKHKKQTIVLDNTLLPQKKGFKNNLSKILTTVLEIKTLSTPTLLKLFFRNIKKTSWFKWQLIFIVYTVLKGIWVRRKKSKQAA